VSDEYVTPAHLDAVRNEMHARIDEHRAEVSGALSTLSAKFDAARSAQEVDSLAMRAALDRLTTEMGKTTKAIDALENVDERGIAIDTALEKFRGQLSKRIYGAVTLLIAVVGLLVAYLH
jgi:pyridoxine/pyridoxamine 5'-phosphate oxidase